jgi:hypothetical protein
MGAARWVMERFGRMRRDAHVPTARLIAALWNLAPCTLLAGPPGSGRTRLLQRELGRALHGGPHLFVGSGGPGGALRALAAGRAQLESGAAPGVLVAIDDVDALLRAPSHDTAAGDARIEVLRWLLDPPPGGHLLLTLRDDAWPLLANWRQHLPHLADQTVTLPAPRPAQRSWADALLPAGMALAAGLVALLSGLLPWRPDVPELASSVSARSPQGGGVAGADTTPDPHADAPSPAAMATAAAPSLPARPRTPPPTLDAPSLLRAAAVQARLAWSETLAGAAPGSVARAGYHQLRGPAAAGWTIVMPLVPERLALHAAPGEAALRWHEAQDRPASGDARALAAAEAAWRALFGHGVRPSSPDRPALQVTLGDTPPPSARPVFLPDERHPLAARLRQEFLPTADGGYAELGYLVVRAPPPGAGAALGQALCDALPALRRSVEPAWQQFEPVDDLPHPLPWDADARAALVRCGDAAPTRLTAAPPSTTPPRGSP